ncbi:hypothetical protein BJX70DRAFT_395371 [Aspergillus crustosus]
MLCDTSTFQELVQTDNRCVELVNQIADGANGVWLWVFLVVRDLLRDISTGETYNTLEARLQSLPRELNRYFTRIMERIDPFFRTDTARILLIMVGSAGPLPLYALSFLRDELVAERYAVQLQVKPHATDTISKSCADLRLQLHARCGDLLVVRTDDFYDAFLQHSADFLNRTVRGFLRDNHHTALHLQAPQGFCSERTLLRMHLALLKSYPMADFRQSISGLFTIVDEILYYAYQLEQTGDPLPQFELLDELDKPMCIHAKGERVHWTNGRSPPPDTGLVRWMERGCCSYLVLAIQMGLRHYVEFAVSRDPATMSKKGRPLLDYALWPTGVTHNTLPYSRGQDISDVYADLVSFLLSKGADPNQPIHIYGGQTPWELFVLFASQNHTDPGIQTNIFY